MANPLDYLLSGAAGLGRGLDAQSERDRLARAAAVENAVLSAQYANLGGRYGQKPAEVTSLTVPAPGASSEPFANLPARLNQAWMSGLRGGPAGLPPVEDPSLSPTSGLDAGSPFGTPTPRSLLSSLTSQTSPDSSMPASTINGPRRPFAPPTNFRLDVPAGQAAPAMRPAPPNYGSGVAIEAMRGAAGDNAPPTSGSGAGSGYGSAVDAMRAAAGMDASGGHLSRLLGSGTQTVALNNTNPRYVDLGPGRYLDRLHTPSAEGESARLDEIALQNQGRTDVAQAHANLTEALKNQDWQAGYDAYTALGFSDPEARAMLTSKGIAERVMAPRYPMPARPGAVHDPNVSAATATNRALGAAQTAMRQAAAAMPKFNAMSLNPRADSTSVIAGRTAPLMSLGDLVARRDSLSSAYDQQSSAIGTGQRANGNVDISGLRAQITDAQAKLNAILSNPSAPLSVKAQAQDAYRNRLQLLGVGTP
jgi:hypothetical protein